MDLEQMKRLEVLIDFLRKKGVLEFQNNGVKLVLTAAPPVVESTPEKPVEAKRSKLFGLTEQEQEDLFMHVVEEAK